MKIAMLSRVWESVPPKAYGGAELVVWQLANGLVDKGHEVTLFASGDSKTKANLDAVIKERIASRKDLTNNDTVFGEIANARNCFDKENEFDIIHYHSGVYPLSMIDFIKKPTVVTIHSLIRENQEQIYKPMKKPYFCSISKEFQKVNPQVKYFDYVYNGIDIHEYKFNPTPKDNFINIGRMIPEKGFKEAAKIAKKAGEKVVFAAPIPKIVNDSNRWLLNENYWEKEVKPLLDSVHAKYAGEIESSEKSNFFGSAKALLFPLQWPEPFGLTVVEAMACGTPVITYNRGAMAELVEDGVTGFVCPPDNEAAMIKAMKNIDQIDRRRCRERVEKLFSVEAMVNKYEDIYKRIVKGRS